MTKKHFNAIARAIRFAPRIGYFNNCDGKMQQAQEDFRKVVAREIATALSDFNPSFDRGRFLIACGVEQGQAHDSAGRRVNY
jgi:hypothetical protein